MRLAAFKARVEALAERPDRIVQRIARARLEQEGNQAMLEGMGRFRTQLHRRDDARASRYLRQLPPSACLPPVA